MDSLDVHQAAAEEEKKNDDAELLGGGASVPAVEAPIAAEVEVTHNPKHYANRHVAAFLALQEQQIALQEQQNESSSQTTQSPSNPTGSLQVVTDGSLLSLESIRNGTLSLQSPVLITDSPASIGMKVPSSLASTLPIRKKQNKATSANGQSNRTHLSSTKCLQLLAAILGPAYPIHVIDVEYQEELDGWTLQDLVEYWQDPERQKNRHGGTGTGTSCQQQSTEADAPPAPPGGVRTAPRRRVAVQAAEAAAESRPRVLNQISLEFSHTPLRKQVQSPQIVRDLDWIDIAWKPQSIIQQQQHDTGGDDSNGGTTIHQDAPAAKPAQPQPQVQYPQVQYYCLTSSAGCYTDFHVDFGGTSVWYHIVSGEKLFCLVPPLSGNLEKYEDWLCRVNQATTFFPSLLSSDTDTANTANSSGLVMVALKANQTLLIPSGWIHAVYTAQDSIVFGGNYLHGLDIDRQISIHSLEVRTRVPERFRFPLFRELHFAAASMYLQKLRRGEPLAALEMDGLPVLMETLELWWKGYQHEEEKVAATMATLNGNVNNSSQGQHQPPPPTISITSTAIQAARQNQYRTVAEFLVALRAEHARVVEQGCGPSPLAQTVVSSIEDDKPVQSSGPAAPRLRLKLSSAVTAAATAATGLTDTKPPLKVEYSIDDDKLQSPEPAPGSPPRLRLKLSSSAVDAASCLTSGTQQSNFTTSTSSFCQQESEASSTPFRINISANSSQPHAAPPVPVAVSRSTKTKTKREDVDWYVDEAVDVRDEEWTPSKRSKDIASSPKSQQRVGTASPAPSSTQPKSQSQRIGTTSRGRAPSPQRAIKKKTTARQRLSKRVGR